MAAEPGAALLVVVTPGTGSDRPLSRKLPRAAGPRCSSSAGEDEFRRDGDRRDGDERRRERAPHPLHGKVRDEDQRQELGHRRHADGDAGRVWRPVRISANAARISISSKISTVRCVIAS